MVLLRKSLELELRAAEAKRRRDLRRQRQKNLRETDPDFAVPLTPIEEGPTELQEPAAAETEPEAQDTKETALSASVETVIVNEPEAATIETASTDTPSTSTEEKPPAPAPLTKDLENNAHQMYTCETAQYFFLQEILPRWESFTAEAAKLWDIQNQQKQHQEETGVQEEISEASAAADFVRLNFPFTSFITGQSNPPEELVRMVFPVRSPSWSFQTVFVRRLDEIYSIFFSQSRSLAEDLSTARSCFRAISCIFNTLEEFRAFELMRTGLERANFLLTQEAKIVAMTCTHAALKRRDLVQLGFTYDTIIMEEAAQILEIETFIPLLLQNPDISGCNRLKRWIMIGDHNQLPPVVKNQVGRPLCLVNVLLSARNSQDLGLCILAGFQQLLEYGSIVVRASGQIGCAYHPTRRPRSYTSIHLTAIQLAI